MKLFVDSANLSDIESALSRGFVAGVTTNPSILAKEPKGDFKKHISKIITLLREYGATVPLSVEVFSVKPQEMLRQAQDFVETFQYENLNIKVPIGWDELKVIHELSRKGISVNCTCCMSLNQAYMAASSGAQFVSLFYGRIRDMGYDGSQVISETKELFVNRGVESEIIVGSIRHIQDVNEAFLAGADIVTVPPKFFPALTYHPKSEEAVNQFVTDFAKWME